MASDIDVKSLTDVDVADLYQKLSDEQSRRSRLEQIRSDIYLKIKEFSDWGGDKATLIAELSVPEPEVPVEDGVGEQPEVEETSDGDTELYF